MKERRRTRINTAKEATLKNPYATIKAVIDNISLKGCLLQVGVEAGFPEGSEAVMFIHLEKDNPEYDIKVKGKIVRREESVIAFDFTEVSPESFHHLLRFVQYNAEDPEEIEAELNRSAYEG